MCAVLPLKCIIDMHIKCKPSDKLSGARFLCRKISLELLSHTSLLPVRRSDEMFILCLCAPNDKTLAFLFGVGAQQQERILLSAFAYIFSCVYRTHSSVALVSDAPKMPVNAYTH